MGEAYRILLPLLTGTPDRWDAARSIPVGKAKIFVTIQLTSDVPDSGVKSAHIRWYTARFILVLEQIRGNLNRYQ